VFGGSSGNESFELSDQNEFVSASLGGSSVFFFNSGAKFNGVIKEGLVSLELVRGSLGKSGLKVIII